MLRLEARYRPEGGAPVVLWTRELPAGREWTLGQSESDLIPQPYRSDWGVNDPRVAERDLACVSAGHVTLRLDGGSLVVRPRAPRAPRSPVIRLDTGTAESGPFRIGAGGGFKFADFEFRVVGDVPVDTPRDPVGGGPSLTLPFDPGTARFLDPAALIRVLLQVIDEADLGKGPEAFAAAVLDTLLGAVPAAGAAALIEGPGRDRWGPPPATARGRVRSAGGRTRDGFVEFSRRMVQEVLDTGRGLVSTRARDGAEGTVVAQTDWGVYAPVESEDGRGLVAYVSGSLSGEMLRGHAELATHPDLGPAREAVQLVARVVAALRRGSRQRRQIRELAAFLPQPVRVLADADRLADLEPRVLPVTVLFCDLRGSCALAECGSADLERYWQQVLQRALHLMAEAVVDQSGVIGSFLGDAVMAFWGWPADDPKQAERALQAAGAIWAKFEDVKAMDDSDLGSLGFGIGIAHGPAVAGRLGSPRQFKVDVVGPTVNLAARLEGLSKQFGMRVILDSAVLDRLPATLRPNLRPLGWVRPVGMTDPVRLYALHTRPGDPVDDTTRKRNQLYEAALSLFELGDWSRAKAELDRLKEVDGPSRFLSDLIGKHTKPPAGPDGRPWPRHASGACVMPAGAK